ncbi:hypothetical protein Pla123a_41990 [Posidoniimonas polymericola]|uniref:DNA ligase (ATP) n=1 Tax=Posidoniimonas polymericola TaxID=2528002 RepID=A0A5C5XZD1_9BACT|nr:hypothetical protein [Posidoniimonas polymericola]TWT67643.1 hypothetical protein Pla123a_41990 [Posidoniimonas polymericola]
MSDTLDSLPGFDGGDTQFAEEPTGPVCEKCECALPDGKLSACPSCGWYASLGIHVDIAPEWEQACSGQPTSGPSKSHAEVWATLVPKWGWLLIGTTLAVAALSLGVRLYTVEDPALRTVWAVCQLLIGASLFAACHLLAFFMAASSDTDMGVMDLVVSPLKGWMKTFVKLPERFWVVNSANITLSATLFAMLIIGGIPYDAVWNWGFKAPAKKNLLGAIAEKAGGNGDMDMEDALNSFADDAAVSGAPLPGGGKSGVPSGIPERQAIDALVIGYELAQDSSIDRLLLATEYNGRLYYAGRVYPQFTEEEAKELPMKFAQAKAPRPFVTVPGSATWLEPKFTCRVTYSRRVESGMLQGIIWEEMLGEVKQSWLTPTK